jgi:hypothetical protein
MNDPQSSDSVSKRPGAPPAILTAPVVAEAGATTDPASPDETVAAGIDPSQVQVVYTDTLPDGVFIMYRGSPARLLVNQAWWSAARPVERIQALESLWARLQTLPPESWNAADTF